MGNRFLSTYVDTLKPHKQFKDDTARIFQSLGGRIIETPVGFQVVDGNYGISLNFVANLLANIVINPIKEGTYEIQVFLNWGWSPAMWVLLILGLPIGGIGLVLLILYLIFDPAPVYQQALIRVVSFEKL
jgi:hypothetical protein